MKCNKLLSLSVFLILGLTSEMMGQGRIDYDSDQGTPTLRLNEVENDRSRLYFSNSLDSINYWAISAIVGQTQAESKMHIFNEADPNGEFLINLVGTGEMGVGEVFPVDRLHVNSQSPMHPFRVAVNSQTMMRVLADGQVAIGRETADSRVHINSVSGEEPLRVELNNETKLLVETNGGVTIGSEDVPPSDGLYVKKDIYVSNTVRINADDNGQGANLVLRDENGEQMIRMEANDDDGDGAEIALFNEDSEPTIKIDAQRGTAEGGYISMRDEELNERIQLYAKETASQGASIKLYDASDSLTIEMDADFNGKGRVITQEIQITGGADLSEHFDITDGVNAVLPGYLVSIDPNSPGKLKITDVAHDHKVVGIVSGANGVSPGMLMRQAGSVADGEYPIALAGRVYAYAIADEDNPILPGDLLTSSDVPGFAMKVQGMEQVHGSIIGKAMTSLHANEGFVLVLVNLQ